MGTLIAVIFLGLILLGMASQVLWLLTSRAFPREQKNPPDLAAFTTTQDDDIQRRA